MSPYLQSGVRGLAEAVAGVGVTYASLAAFNWFRYGRSGGSNQRSGESGLDKLLPEYEVATRHRILVRAPVGITFAAASGLHLQDSAIVRALFRTRDFVLGSAPETNNAPMLGLFDQARRWGWGVLSEDPGREIIFGAITQPWLAQPVFRALSPADFAEFHEPGFAKIAWTITVHPANDTGSVVTTQTRVTTTDPSSRTKFRRYWALAMPGIVLIRWALLWLVKQNAEACVRKDGAKTRRFLEAVARGRLLT